MPYVITLVHGTRLWPFTRSRCYDYRTWKGLERETLETYLDETVELRCFNWRGNNSHSVRQRAAPALEMFVNEALDARPNSKHYVIAHSHGGNIALDALSTPSLSNHPRVGGVICLATPFLFMSKTAATAFPPVILNGSVVSFLLFAVWLSQRCDLSVLRAAFSASLVFGPLFVVFALMWGNTKAIRDDLRPPTLSSRKIHIIRHPGDEASAFLSIGRLAAWLSYNVAMFIGRFERVSIRHARIVDLARLTPMVVVLVAGYAWALGFPIVPPALDSPLKLGGFLVLMGLAAIAAPGITLGLLSLVVCAIGVLPLGLQLAAAAPFVRLGIESSPEGACIVHLLPSTTATLEHSAYADPAVIELIYQILATGDSACLGASEPGPDLG